jgi:AraC-like DNA-binding protein
MGRVPGSYRQSTRPVSVPVTEPACRSPPSRVQLGGDATGALSVERLSPQSPHEARGPAAVRPSGCAKSSAKLRSESHHFARAFTAEIGTTPAKALKRLRLEIARTALVTSHAPLGRIAEQIGFGDPDRMRRAFIRTFGRPPQALRRAVRFLVPPSFDAKHGSCGPAPNVRTPPRSFKRY